MSMKSMESCERFPCVHTALNGRSFAEEALWQGMPFVSLVETVIGNRPRQKTTVRALYDRTSNALCFCFEAEDDWILCEFTKHDDPIYLQDVVEIFITDGKDRHAYKEFEVSPTNIRFDADIRYTDAEHIDVGKEWDLKGWQTVTTFDAERKRLTSYWYLPLEGWAQVPAIGDVWTVNAYRIDHSEFGEELQAWRPTYQPNFHVPECFGELVFVEGGA